MKQIKFLTTNHKKSLDFQLYGFSVEAFQQEIDEIKHNDVEMVALHKAIDTNMNNIVVEDTALYIENSTHLGTDIKHVYEDMLNYGLYENEKAIWKVCLCAKKDNHYILSTGELQGKIIYPPSDFGYHFEKFFGIEFNGDYFRYGELPKNFQKTINPRFEAIEGLVLALQHNDFSKVKVLEQNDILPWNGDYQVENKKFKLPF